MGFFDKIKAAVKKTRDSFMGKLESVVNSFTKIDESLFEEIEEILITSDVGVHTSEKICGMLRSRIKERGLKEKNEIILELRKIICQILECDADLKLDTTPSVILVVGVNGVGKTTTIGKLANLLKSQGKSVILAAADTFRAGAVEQLEIWAGKVGCDIVSPKKSNDPASVVFDAIFAAKARKSDVIICDTAGRLHNKKNLMDELAKIRRIISRELPNSSVESLLVLDASIGQNSLIQAQEFKKIVDITGIVLTKLDGTAKGGIVIAICDTLGVPVKFIGTGETVESIAKFDSLEFASAIFDD